MRKIASFLKRRFKKPDQPIQDEVVNALLSYRTAQERDLKEKHRKLRYVRPKESIEFGNIALAQFLINHKILSEIGERTVLHDLNLGVYGKPGESKHTYVSAWLKDMEYERALDYADEANNLARVANKAAEDAVASAREANTIARRALWVAAISAIAAIISAIAAYL